MANGWKGLFERVPRASGDKPASEILGSAKSGVPLTAGINMAPNISTKYRGVFAG